MKKITLSMFGISFLSLLGCTTMRPDPTLAKGVTREGTGIYSSSELNLNNPTQSAIAQCQLDGNKRLAIISTTTTHDYWSGKAVPKFIFRCE